MSLYIYITMWGTITSILFSKPVVLFVVSIVVFILLRLITRDADTQQKKVDDDTDTDDNELNLNTEDIKDIKDIKDNVVHELDIWVYLEIGVSSVISSILVNAFI